MLGINVIDHLIIPEKSYVSCVSPGVIEELKNSDLFEIVAPEYKKQLEREQKEEQKKAKKEGVKQRIEKGKEKGAKENSLEIAKHMKAE